MNVRVIGCDFMAFSSHKMCGPMGVGVLWGRRELLEAMAPYQLGSNMAHDVDLESEHLSPGALKFSAGTPNVSGPVGLAVAMQFMRELGADAIIAHERDINRRMIERLGAIRGVRLLGSRDPDRRVSVFSFTVQGRTPMDVLKAMEADAKIRLKELRVDGGASANDLLMQLQADLLNVPVVRPKVAETTALGAAYLAGLAVGFWKSQGDIARQWQVDKRFTPAMKSGARKQITEGWARALERAKAWVE